jgi:hypothetical protein
MSAIHKRLYYGMKQEFKILARVFSEYLPPEYPYDVFGGERTIKQTDFDDRVDILPVADPNIFLNVAKSDFSTDTITNCTNKSWNS